MGFLENPGVQLIIGINAHYNKSKNCEITKDMISATDHFELLICQHTYAACVV